MSEFDRLRGDAEKLAAEHPEQAERVSDEAIQRGGEAADKATGNRFDEQIGGAEKRADEAIGEGGNSGGGSGGQNPGDGGYGKEKDDSGDLLPDTD